MTRSTEWQGWESRSPEGSVLQSAWHSTVLHHITLHRTLSVWSHNMYMYSHRPSSWAPVCADTALDPHEVMYNYLPIFTFPLHGIGLSFVGDTASTAFTGGAIFRPILFHTWTSIVLKFHGFTLSKGVLTLPPSPISIIHFTGTDKAKSLLLCWLT